MSDTETPEPDEASTPETAADLGGSAIVGMVKTEIAEHPTVFSPEAEGPMLPGQTHEHATPFEYVLIAIGLCVITAFEVFLYYQEEHWSHSLIVGLLLPLSFIKFLVVAAFYMHLKSDRPVYRRFFAVAGVLAFVVFTIAVVTIGGRFNASVAWGMFGIGVVMVGLFVTSFALRWARNG